MVLFLFEKSYSRVSLMVTSHLQRSYTAAFRSERLSGLFVLLYINDLPNCLIHSQPRMYADEEEKERRVNIALERIRTWLAANKLTL